MNMIFRLNDYHQLWNFCHEREYELAYEVIRLKTIFIFEVEYVVMDCMPSELVTIVRILAEDWYIFPLSIFGVTKSEYVI